MEQNLLLFFPPENCYFAGIKLSLRKLSGCSQELPAFALATACVGNTETGQGASLLNNSAALGCSCLAGVSSLSSQAAALWCVSWGHTTNPRGRTRPWCHCLWAKLSGRGLLVQWCELGSNTCWDQICSCWNSGCHTQSFRPDAWFHHSSIQTCPVSQ